VEILPRSDPVGLGFDRGALERLRALLDGWIERQRLAGVALAVARSGEVAFEHYTGWADRARELPVTPETVYRIYSMTKPITSIAALQLVEEGLIALDDPIERYVPVFANPRVLLGGGAPGGYAPAVTRPATEPIRLWHLLTHTAGLTYAFHHQTAVDAQYRALERRLEAPSLAAWVEAHAEVPLLFDPGTHWNYSIATDVLGHLVSVVRGVPLAEVLRRWVLEPLGMEHTTFELDEGALARLAAIVTPGGDGTLHRLGPAVPEPRTAPYDSGGGGLFSTLEDYLRFAVALEQGGRLGTAKLVSPLTLVAMRRNHLPGGADIPSLAVARPQPGDRPGTGFGLGVSVVIDPARAHRLGPRGSYGWGGMASTTFFVWPRERVAVVFMTQLVPSNTYPLAEELETLVAAALDRP
jgi:CubicO group peptidase (beta-lactamase class C family)